MGFITNIKKTIRGDSEEVQQFHQEQPEQQEQRVIPKRTYQSQRQTRFDDGCDGYYNKGNWWDDSDDIDHREYVEDAFDQYAREFHSAETDEERYAIFNQDRSWMMN